MAAMTSLFAIDLMGVLLFYFDPASIYVSFDNGYLYPDAYLPRTLTLRGSNSGQSLVDARDGRSDCGEIGDRAQPVPSRIDAEPLF